MYVHMQHDELGIKKKKKKKKKCVEHTGSSKFQMKVFYLY